MKKQLLLFDVDHTLTDNYDSDLPLYFSVIEKIYGVSSDKLATPSPGLTIRSYIVGLLANSGLESKQILSHLDLCLSEIDNSFFKIKDYKINAIDGVVETLDLLKNQGHILALTTGNSEVVAHHKLSYAGIKDYFSFGGYGDAYMQRRFLIEDAINIAKMQFNFQPDHNIFVMGDTPWDIKAGKEAGDFIKTVGVTTGHFSEKHLKEYAPSYVIKNLRELPDIIRQSELSDNM